MSGFLTVLLSPFCNLLIFIDNIFGTLLATYFDVKEAVLSKKARIMAKAVLDCCQFDKKHEEY